MFLRRGNRYQRGEIMNFSHRSIRRLIKMSIYNHFRISKTAISELNDIISIDAKAIAKIASEIAGNANRTTIMEEDIIEAYSALFL